MFDALAQLCSKLRFRSITRTVDSLMFAFLMLSQTAGCNAAQEAGAKS
jgi:hypothetical protein